MTIKTKSLILTPHLPGHLQALVRSEREFENTSGLRVADGLRAQLLSASREFLDRIKTAKQPDPWQFGFAIIHTEDNIFMGNCGFPGPPSSDGFAEIAYGIAPVYQGQGYATEAAMALIGFATNDARVKRICAHTLAEINGSTRVLEKCGFKKVSDTVDPENGLLVWRWERGLSGE